MRDYDRMRKVRSRLTEDDVKYIRRRLAYGDGTRREIAKEFGLSKGAIDRIATGDTWAWVGDERLDQGLMHQAVEAGSYSAAGVAKAQAEVQDEIAASLARFQKLAAQAQPKPNIVERVTNRLTDRSSDGGGGDAESA
jgi:hypothetical protein